MSLFDPAVFDPDVFDTEEGEVVVEPGTPAASTHVSLLVGSDALGWQELGDRSVLGQMTRAMPGGDGSLEFTLYGDDAWAARNVLVPGARVKLAVGGSAQWAGKLLSDPVRQRIGSPGRIAVDAGGLNAWAARFGLYGYPGMDTDAAQWRRVKQKYNSGTGELESLLNSGRFTADTNGRLHIEGDDNRSYAGYADGRLAYWLFGGLDLGYDIVAVDLDYKCNVPTGWHVRLRSTTGTPWDYDSTTSELDETTTRSSWHEETIDLTLAGAKSIFLDLQNGSGADTPTTSPWVTVRSVTVYFRMDGATVDRGVTLADGLGDVATLSGLATVTDISFPGLLAPSSLMVRPESGQTPADVLRTLAASHSSEVEYGFYLDADGADAFYANALPSSPNAARNRTWSYGDRAGESTDDLVRDYEAAPEYVAIEYLSSGVVTMPDGTPRVYWHPSQPSDLTANLQVISDWADVKLTETEAASTATRLWARRRGAQWTGEIPIPETVVDVAGVTRPGYTVRPGDRVNCHELDGGSALYVAETSWDWAAMTGTATIGWPFEGEGGRITGWSRPPLPIPQTEFLLPGGSRG